VDDPLRLLCQLQKSSLMQVPTFQIFYTTLVALALIYVNTHTYARARTHTHTRTHARINTHTHQSMDVCVCVCILHNTRYLGSTGFDI
jgi:hypothetical protein